MALTCFVEVEENMALKIYPYVLFFTSLFLIFTFIIYAILPEMRNVHGVTVMCLVVSMTVMYIGLGIIQLGSDMDTWLCVTIGDNYTIFKKCIFFTFFYYYKHYKASVVHFAFLSTFTWLKVMFRHLLDLPVYLTKYNYIFT
jgi:hypothetical protein